MTSAVPRSVREGAVYLLAGTLSRAVSLLLLPLYTRNLDDAEVGAFGVITALMLFLQIMTIAGLDSATGRWYFHEPEPAARRSTFATWATNQLAASTVVFVVLAVLARPVAAAFTGDADRFSSTVRLAGATLVTGTLPNILYNWFRLARRPVPAGLAAFGIAAVTVVASAVALLGLDLGVDGAFGAQVAAGATMSVITVLAMRGAVSPTSASRKRWREMLRFALPLVPGGAAFWVIGVADRFLLRALSTLSEAGRYHVVATVSSGLALATQAFQQTWGPMALEMKDRPTAHATYRAALVGYLALGTTLVIGVAAVGDTILRLVKPSYVELLPDLTVLTASVVATGALAIVTVGATIAGTSRPIFDGVVAAAAVNTVANLVLIPGMGSMGAAWATLLAMLVLSGVALARSERVLPIGFPTGVSAAIIAVAAIAASCQVLVSTRTNGIQRAGSTAAVLVLGGGCLYAVSRPHLGRRRIM